MPPEGVAKIRHGELPGLEELGDLAAWLTAHTNIEKIKLTGGEPLLRPGLGHLVASLTSLAAVREVSLTTNGSLLPQMAWSLRAAGLARVNISLDSLDEERFAEVTRGGRLKNTLAGIEAARQADLQPIKLNSVLRRSTWQREVPDLLDYAAENGLEIRFIELMRTGTERTWCESEFVSMGEVRSELGLEIQAPAVDELAAAPARRTSVNWHGCNVVVGWIAPRSHPFCGRCERLRMDARGHLRRCLMDPQLLDLPELMRRIGPSAAWERTQSYLAGKTPPRKMDSALAMNRIGG